MRIRISSTALILSSSFLNYDETLAFSSGNLVFDLSASSTQQQRQPQRNGGSSSRITARRVSASLPSHDENDSSNSSIEYLDALIHDFNEANRIDAEQNAQTEQMLSERRQKLRERFASATFTTDWGTYRIQLPLHTDNMGITLTHVSPGRVVSEKQLNLDTMRITALPNDAFAPTVPSALDSSFRGLLVTAVVPDSPAAQAGVQVGDILVAASATWGSAVWPTSTLEGVQSALSSRRLTSQRVTLELRRLEPLSTAEDSTKSTEPVITSSVASVTSSKTAYDTAAAASSTSTSTTASPKQFELTLSKPLGFSIGQDNDGYVVVTDVGTMAPTLVKYAVAVGDRIVAVDSSLGGQLWPTSTVEGVISAVTGRLPGQAVTVRFERPVGSVGPAVADRPPTTVAPVVPETRPAKTQELLKRCRDVLRKYTIETVDSNVAAASTTSKRATALQKMPGLVADKVVDALASASAQIDAVTLSMIMNAYLSCGQTESAIRLFEAATGLSGDGATTPAKHVIASNQGGQIVPTESAINLYTGTILLQAHALLGDLGSVLRVLAALEGRSGVMIDHLESAPWPWTGAYGAIQPDTVCYNIAIAAAEKAGGVGALSRALELFNRMEDATSSGKTDSGVSHTGPVKNQVTYNTMISALCNAKRFDEALDLFDRMQRDGLRPDKYTYTSLIQACPHDTQELLYDMRERGIQADVVTYNTIIQSLCRKRQWTQATRLVTEMESRGVAPDARTYGLLMNGMLKADKASACVALFESACASPWTVPLTENVHLYTTAITAVSVLGDHSRALDYVARMTSKGIKPNIKTLTAVMGACLASKQPELAAQVFEKIDQPDGYALSQGIRALCESGGAPSLARAASLLESQTPGQSLLPGRQMMFAYQQILEAALEEKDYDLARRMFTDLLSKGFIPSKSILLSIVHALERSNLRARSATEVEEWALTDKQRFSFLLFAIDSVQQRNLPVEGILYVATISLGAQLDGVARKVSSIMAEVKATSTNARPEVMVVMASSSDSSTSVNNNTVVEVKLPDRWEDLLHEYELFSLATDDLLVEHLPPLRVRVSPRDMVRVLRAEQAVTTSLRRKSGMDAVPR